MAGLTNYQGVPANRQLVVRPDQWQPKESTVEGERTKQAAVHRRTLDWSGPYVRQSERRQQQPPARWFEPKPLQPTAAAALEMLPPSGYADQPGSSFCTKFVHSSRFKSRGSIMAIAWTPEGRRCLTGTSNGEFTLWNGSTFHYETQLQAHEAGVRNIVFTHNENWLVTSDAAGQVKYWKLNLELVKVVAAHRESVRGLAFSCTDLKFVTASDDSTLKVWDFATATPSATMTGHGGDVKACDWHPSKSLVASGSKDTLIKLWDARAGASALQTLHAHKAPLSSLAWHHNGRWLLSSARDHLVKVWDLRTLKEVATCRGHPRDVACAAWHPWQEEAFVSGDYDGNILHWLLSRQGPQAEVRGAHQGQVWALAFHPVGHCLASGGYDGQVRFWCRTRPGDAWLDRAPHDAHLLNAPADAVASNMGLSLGSGGDAIPGIGDVEVAAPTVAQFEMNPGTATEADDISSQLLAAPVPAPRPPSGPPPAPAAAPPGAMPMQPGGMYAPGIPPRMQPPRPGFISRGGPRPPRPPGLQARGPFPPAMQPPMGAGPPGMQPGMVPPPVMRPPGHLIPGFRPEGPGPPGMHPMAHPMGPAGPMGMVRHDEAFMGAGQGQPPHLLPRMAPIGRGRQGHGLPGRGRFA